MFLYFKKRPELDNLFSLFSWPRSFMFPKKKIFSRFFPRIFPHAVWVEDYCLMDI